ncbi:MAG: GHMP kinase [Acidimicrobiia bacterium]|nr:GHMP kinase [Acidimicrobiia bacterium]
MISHAAPSRVGILGNPSDGYGGRTLALAVPQFEATVHLEEAPGIEIAANPGDEPCWPSMSALVDHVDRHGYGTGPQLLAATVRTFADVAETAGIELRVGARLGYDTTIPRQVGLGGSSALVVATLRCLCEHYDVHVPEEVLPSIALRVETEQLGITAGLQDRVVQTYGGLVAMDFGETHIDTRFGVSHGAYEPVDAAGLPPLFLSYRQAAAEPSDAYHHDLRARFESGNAIVRDTMRELATLVVEGRAALRWGDRARFASLIGRNMQLRKALGPLPSAQLELVDVAAALGAQATFAGSGGAVVGAFDDESRFDTQFEALCDAYADVGADVVRLDQPSPTAPAEEEADGAPSNVVAFEPRGD